MTSTSTTSISHSAPESFFRFKYMRYRVITAIISLALVLGSIYLFVSKGDDKYGIDFVGGTDVVVKFDNLTSASSVREALIKGGFPPGITVQNFGDLLFDHNEAREYSIRVKGQSGDAIGKQIQSALETNLSGNPFIFEKQDFVGPIIGEQIREDGLIALGLALLGILIYVAVRFEFRFAVGAIVALIHDVIIAAGVFLYFGGELNASVLAALLTIIGYSINDTIIIFDRIRENFAKAMKTGSARKLQKIQVRDFIDLVDVSINQTMSRTLLTSGTTLIVVTCLWLLGGGAIADLAFPLFVGIIIGTYSTVYIASPIVLLGIKPKKDN